MCASKPRCFCWLYRLMVRMKLMKGAYEVSLADLRHDFEIYCEENNMRKICIFAFCLCVIMMIAFAACGSAETATEKNRARRK